MPKYYGKFVGHKMYHVVHATSVENARTRMQEGTKFKKSEIIIKTKKPRTKFPIAGR